MSDNDSFGPLDQDEVDAQAAALQQTWRENVERSTSVRRSFVHLRQEDATMKAIPRRSRMQSLIQEGRVKEIEFSTRHTVEQMANLLATNMPTLAGVNPTSITILKSCNRGSEMIRVFRGLTNGYNLNNAFRQRSKKIFIDSGGLLTVSSTTTTVASVAPALTSTTYATLSTSATVVNTTLPLAVTSPASLTASSPAMQRRISASPRASGSGQGGMPSYQENSQDVQIVAVRAGNQLVSDIISTKGMTMEISEVIQSGGEVRCRETMEGAEVFDIEGPLQQIQLLRLLMQKNNISLMFTPCPFTFHQAIIQSHHDLKPIVVLLFDDSDESVDLIRAMNENGDLVRTLDSCLVLVAHSGSPFVPEMLENVGEDPHILTGAHVLILQHFGLAKRQIVGAWLAGHQIKPDEVMKHVQMTMQNVTAISMQRQMLEETREEQDNRTLESRDLPSVAATPLATAVQSPVAAAVTSNVPSASFSPCHISVKLVKPSGNMIMLTVDKRRRVESILTDEERNAGVDVRMFSGDNVSVVIPLDSIFEEIVGAEKQVLLRLEKKQ